MTTGKNAAQGPRARTCPLDLERAIRLINETRREKKQDEEARCGLLREAILALMGRRSGGEVRSRTIFLPATRAVAPLEALLEELLDHPAQRLAVYGTLAPGARNHQVIAGIGGTWEKGRVPGVLGRIGPYPAFQWRPRGKPIPVQVLSSPRLPDHWARLDRFEGDAYRRILAPVTLAQGVVQVANMYEGIQLA